MSPHVCDPLVCGIDYDPDCPVWKDFSRELLVDPAAPDWKRQALLAADAIEMYHERQRQDRAAVAARRLMVEQPQLAEALLWLFATEFQEVARQSLREIVREIVRDVMADELPAALEALRRVVQ